MDAGLAQAREALQSAGRYSRALVVQGNAGGSFRLEPATLDDVPELARLNLSVRLDMADCEAALLDPETGFARRGGFFKVMGADDLRRCLRDERSLIFVLRDVSAGEDTRRIVASLWVSLEDLGFVEHSASLIRSLHEHPALAAALREGRVCYARELIVARDAPRFISPDAALFSGSFSSLHATGFAYALSEVYRVVDYCTGTSPTEAGPESSECGHAVNILNEAALHSVAEAGGLRIARNRPRKLDFEGGLSVTIEPEVILFDFAVTLPVLAKRLQEQETVLDVLAGGEQDGSDAYRKEADGSCHV
jgi:hypothetical protein